MVRLWGREDAVSAIEAALSKARQAEGNVLCLIGDAGLGKTTLLDHAREQSSGMLIGEGHGEITRQAVPFGVLRQISADLGADTDNSGWAVEPAAPYYRSLRWLQERASAPVLLLVDDLHWCDPDSLRVLGFLARRVSSLPVAMIVAMRSSPTATMHPFDELARDGSARIERLALLDRADTVRLIDNRIGRLMPGVAIERAWELCQGHPLLASELARALDAGRSLGDLDGAGGALAVTLKLPGFTALSASTMAFARAASVLGTAFQPAVAGEIANLLGSELDRALAELSDNRLVIDQPDGRLRFAHPMFGDALYDALLAPIRTRLHGRAFAALAQRGLDTAAANQARRGDLVGDQHAIAVLQRTGDVASSAGAVASALVDYDTAIRFSGDRPAPRLLLAQANVLVAAGRLPEAEQACARILAQPGVKHLDQIDALRLIGRIRHLTGAPDYGDRAFYRAVEIAYVDNDVVRAAEAMLDQSLSAWQSGGAARALPLADRARRLTTARVPGSATATLAEQVWSHIALEAGVPDGIVAAQRSVDTQGYTTGTAALKPAELPSPWTPIYHVGMNASHLERYDEAEAVFTVARTVAERAGAANVLATLAVHFTNLFIRRGRLVDALVEAARAEDFAELTPAVAPYARIAGADALAWLGRDDESSALCAQVADEAGGQWLADLWRAHVQGMLLLWRADPRASDELLLAEQLTRAAGIREPCHLQWGARAVDAHLRVGRVAEARGLVDWLEECAAPLPCRWPRIATAVGRAHLAAHDGRVDEADEQFQLALALHEEVELPLHRVETLVSYGAMLRRSGRPADARLYLAAASRRAARLGAGSLERIADNELRLAGGRRRGGVSDDAELTTVERQVAVLAAAGHANSEIAKRLYLSENEVRTHLKNTYSKLGISSRWQLISLHDQLTAAERD